MPSSRSYLSHRRPSSVGRKADGPPMKLGLVENCWWSSPVGPVDGMRLAKDIGFDSYDVFFLDTPGSTREAQRKALQECGLPCSSFIVAANGLTDFVPEMRKFSIGYVKQQVDLGLSLTRRRWCWSSETIPTSSASSSRRSSGAGRSRASGRSPTTAYLTGSRLRWSTSPAVSILLQLGLLRWPDSSTTPTTTRSRRMPTSRTCT